MSNTLVNETGVSVNSDGLWVMYPPAAARDAVVGSTNFNGDDQELILSLDFSRLPAFSANEATGRIYGTVPLAAIPDGALIKSAVLTVDTAFDSGGSATLSVGLVTVSGGTVTEVDNDGLIDAATEANMDTAGKVITGAGALINTKLAAGAPCYVWVSVQTISFTTGHGRLKITYYMPTDEAVSH
jgi:hypothetical protein